MWIPLSLSSVAASMCPGCARSSTAWHSAVSAAKRRAPRLLKLALSADLMEHNGTTLPVTGFLNSSGNWSSSSWELSPWNEITVQSLRATCSRPSGQVKKSQCFACVMPVGPGGTDSDVVLRGRLPADAPHLTSPSPILPLLQLDSLPPPPDQLPLPASVLHLPVSYRYGPKS